MNKRDIAPIIAASALIFAMPPSASADPQDLLADGIDGLVRTPADSAWSVEDGVLMPGRGEDRSYVITNARYANLEITLEFFPEAGTNSGVFGRCQDPQEVSPVSCYEFNIWDAHPDQESRTGAIVTHAPPVAFVETEGRWNTMRVRLEGPRLRMWVNDTLTNDIEHAGLSEGFVALQYGGENGMVKFRNVFIEELP